MNEGYFGTEDYIIWIIVLIAYIIFQPYFIKSSKYAKCKYIFFFLFTLLSNYSNNALPMNE